MSTIPVGQETLLPIVRQALGDSSVEVELWESEQLRGGIGGGSVWRISGTGLSSGTTRPWSLILKGISAANRPGWENSLPPEIRADILWNRESLLYQSDYLDRLNGGLRTPRCYQIYEQSDEVWMWLEDVPDAFEEKWPVAQYGIAARHLGQFNGSYLVDKPLPKDVWVGTGRLAEHLASLAQGFDRFYAEETAPDAIQIRSPELSSRVFDLWQYHPSLKQSVTHGLPRTFGHFDASARNLRAVSADETVAIDWAYAGVAPLGEEPACLLCSSLLWLFMGKMDQAKELDEVVFTGYLRGLSDTGWKGDPRLVRYGYTAMSAMCYALRYGMSRPPYLTDETRRLEGEKWLKETMGCSVDEVKEHIPLLNSFLLELADEARQLQTDLF